MKLQIDQLVELYNRLQSSEIKSRKITEIYDLIENSYEKFLEDQDDLDEGSLKKFNKFYGIWNEKKHKYKKET